LTGDPTENGIGEKTVTQSKTQGLKAAGAVRSGLSGNGDISQNERTVPILEIGLPSSAVWIVGVFGPIDVVRNERQDHDIRILFIQKKFGPKKSLVDPVRANAGVEHAFVQDFFQMRRPRLTIFHLISKGE
jgi:hypothetical protein